MRDPIEEAADDLRLLSAMCLERGFEHAGLCLNFRAHWIKNTGLSPTLGYLTALQCDTHGEERAAYEMACAAVRRAITRVLGQREVASCPA